MKKKLLVLWAASVCVMSLIGCGKEVAVEETEPASSIETVEEVSSEDVEQAALKVEDEIKEESSEEVTEEISEEETVETTANTAELSDDIYSFQVSVDGVVYQFPMWVSEFEALGWTYDGDFSQTLSSNQYTTTEVWKRGEGTVYTRLANLSMNTVSFKESMVAGITFDAFNLRKCDIEIIMPKGIQFGVSTAEDIIAAYGEPSYEFDGSAFRKLGYEYDYHQEVFFQISKETGVLSNIEIENMIELEGADNSVSAKVPEIISGYKAPQSVGDDLYQYNIELEGKLYTLPCPVSELLANGFTINENNSDSEFAAGNGGWLELRYNNQSYRCIVRNYADYATTAENCFLTTMESSIYGPDFDLIIPCGIKRGDKEADVLEIIKEFNYEEETPENSSFTYYTITNPEGSRLDKYVIAVKEDEVVMIEVSNTQEPEY